MDMLAVSRALLLLAFAAYFLGAVVYVTGTLRSRMALKVAEATAGGAASAAPAADRPTAGFWLVAAGVALHLFGMILRWTGGGHFPTSNMFEYMTFLGWGVMLCFIIIQRVYHLNSLGAVVPTLGMLILAYASIFPREVQPLIPALQSYWLVLHVGTVALGEAAFAVAFGAGLIYLLRKQLDDDFTPAGQRTLEFLLYALCALAAFILLALAFNLMDYEAPVPGTFTVYSLPPVIGPPGLAAPLARLGGLELPLITAPQWLAGGSAPRHLNTLLFAFVGGAVLYAVLRLILRSPLRVPLGRLLRHTDLDTMDEIGYRAVAVGFPLFTLGGLLFAMIWAQQAWGRYWGWDPKETWALITWLFYAGYLHLRLTQGWQGAKAAWLAVVGFAVVMFTLLGVNLLIVGLHSYAV